jgi:hypothetical protein
LFGKIHPFHFVKYRKTHQRLKKVHKELRKPYVELYEELFVAQETLQHYEYQKGLDSLVHAIEEQNDWSPHASHEDGRDNIHDVEDITKKEEQEPSPNPTKE